MTTAVDFSCFAREDDGRRSLYLQVEGMRCASCAWKIEQTLTGHPGVEARVNFSTQRLRLSWPRALGPESANAFAKEIEALGFHVAPFDPDSRAAQARLEERTLLTYLAVSGFATAAIMLFADALWFSRDLEGPSRDLMHWFMGLIAMPATLYCGQPFFRSAISALKSGRANMDVPISLAVILANALSLFETINHGRYVYFDASIMLLFFLLIGRYLDLKARGKAREAAQGLLAMLDGTARVLKDGQPVAVRIRDVRPGDVLIVTAGEKIAADGIVVAGRSDIDTRLVTGETLPRPVACGEKLYAGMINQSAPLHVEVSAAADDSLLSEIVVLMEKAEQSQSVYVRFADRVASLYAPIVHILALATFVGWIGFGYFTGGAVPWEDALLKAMAVLIITCPCALGLAVPVVHVLASSYLFSRGILLKSGKGLEALAGIDTVVFDKTGTLTEGQPHWLNPHDLEEADRRLAVAIAHHSRHPLSQAISAAECFGLLPEVAVADHPGDGLAAMYDGEPVKLGRAAWLGLPSIDDHQIELWFQRGTRPPVRLTFADIERRDADDTISDLKQRGLHVIMLSGDRRQVAEALGAKLGIADVRAALSPVDKVRAIEDLHMEGHRVLMVGDGLNDAAALTAAAVSMSPSSGMDITQNAADLVYRGDGVAPIVTAFDVARRTRLLVRQNFALSLAYNVLAVPAAVLGVVTPLIAAIAMSSSSLVVVLNSLRLNWRKSK